MEPIPVQMTDEIDRRVLERLREMEKREGDSSRFAKIYGELFHIQMEARLHAGVTRPILEKPLIENRLRQGIPLLLLGDFQPDWNQVHTVFKKILDWAAKDSEVPPEMNKDLGNMGSEPDLLRETAEAWYRGLSLTPFSAAQRIDTGLLTSVVAATLKPFLSAYARLLLPEVDQERWRRGVCPLCGGKPDFSFLKEGGARWLLCSRCDGEWRFSRIGCPYCGNRRQEALAYFSDEARAGLYRLHVCEACRCYIKGIDLRVTGSEALLPLERVLTFDLDRKGQERGYRAGGVTWGNEGGHWAN